MADLPDQSDSSVALPSAGAAERAQSHAHARFHDLVYKPGSSSNDPADGPQSAGPGGSGFRSERAAWMNDPGGTQADQGYGDGERSRHHRHHDDDGEGRGEEEHHHRRGHEHGGHHGRMDAQRTSDQGVTDGSSSILSLEDQLRANGNLNPETMAALNILQRAVAPTDLMGSASDRGNGINVTGASASDSYNNFGVGNPATGALDTGSQGNIVTAQADTSALQPGASARTDYGAYQNGVADTSTLQPGVTPQGDGSTLQSGVTPQGDGSTLQSGITPQGDTSAVRTQALAPQDVQTITALWAAANGTNTADAASYQKVAASPDGSSWNVGPYQLDGKNIAQWVGSITGQNGQIDQASVAKLVQGGEISGQTAQALTSPEFAQFAAALQSGKPPAADQVAKMLTPELQTAIAGEMVNALAGAQQTGQLDPGVLIASLKIGRPLTQTDLADPAVKSFVTALDSQLSGQAGGQGSAGKTADASATSVAPMDNTAVGNSTIAGAATVLPDSSQQTYAATSDSSGTLTGDASAKATG